MAHILLMEDDADQAYLLHAALTGFGHDVTSATTGENALSLCRHAETPYDLIITDLLVRVDGAPVSDGGISLIGRLRTPQSDKNLKWFAKVPIIAISGAPIGGGLASVLDAAEVLGANVILKKPLEISELREHIDQLLTNAPLSNTDQSRAVAE